MELAEQDPHRIIALQQEEIKRLHEQVAFLKQKLDNPAFQDTEEDINEERDAAKQVETLEASAREEAARSEPQKLPNIILTPSPVVTAPIPSHPAPSKKPAHFFVRPLKHYPRKLWDRFFGEHVMVYQPYPHPYILFQSTLIAFIGIAAIALSNQYLWKPRNRVGVLGSMGAVSGEAECLL